MTSITSIFGVKSRLSGANVSMTQCHSYIPLVGRELIQLLFCYFNGSLRQWEDEARLQRDRAIRYLDDLEKIPTTGRRLLDVVTADQMDAIRDRLGAEKTVVEGQARPGWHIHALKCWCKYYSATDPDFAEWPKLTYKHKRRAVRQFCLYLSEVINAG